MNDTFPQVPGFVWPKLHIDHLEHLTEEMKDSLVFSYFNDRNPYIEPNEPWITDVELTFDEEFKGFKVRLSTGVHADDHRAGGQLIYEDAGYLTHSSDGHFATSPMAGDLTPA